MRRGWERLADAEANRAAEGLRVLEDAARFLLDAADLARALKELRHELRAALPPQLIAARDTEGDVGTALKAGDEGARAGLAALLRANAARAAEALRCLEESGKLVSAPWWPTIERVRYRLYTIERDLLARVPSWRLWQCRLYVLIDAALCADPPAVAAAAARGGAEVLQLRAKQLPVRAYRELAARVQEAARAHGALFIVNDHVAIARALGADGVHLGQDDLDPRDARTVLGPLALIGVSAHTAEQAAEGQRHADYLGLGPMFPTASKPHEPCRGPELLDAVRGSLRVPSYAIGGIDAERLPALLPRLPHGIAVAGAVCRAADPERAVRRLLALLSGADARRDPGLQGEGSP